MYQFCQEAQELRHFDTINSNLTRQKISYSNLVAFAPCHHLSNPTNASVINNLLSSVLSTSVDIQLQQYKYTTEVTSLEILKVFPGVSYSIWRVFENPIITSVIYPYIREVEFGTLGHLSRMIQILS